MTYRYQTYRTIAGHIVLADVEQHDGGGTTVVHGKVLGADGATLGLVQIASAAEDRWMVSTGDGWASENYQPSPTRSPGSPSEGKHGDKPRRLTTPVP